MRETTFPIKNSIFSGLFENNLAIVLKPSHGNFGNYCWGNDLHIGIFDGKNRIVSFGTNGLVSEFLESHWKNLLVICQLPKIKLNNLLAFCAKNEHHFCRLDYQEKRHNCLDFVLTFCRAELKWNHNRTSFVYHVVYPPLKIFLNKIGHFASLKVMKSRPELPELKGLMMADLLEEKAVEDVDRNIDNCSFLRDQFDIFKHDYREAFDAHGHETLANLSLNPELKKEVVTMMRQLQKAKIKIGSYTHFQGKDREVMDDLLQKISEVQKELERVSHGKTDFTIENVELPEFDEDAIKALFGSEDPNIKESNAKKTLEKLCDFNRIFAEKVSSVLGAATLLLTGYKEIEDYVKYLESK